MIPYEQPIFSWTLKPASLPTSWCFSFGRTCLFAGKARETGDMNQKCLNWNCTIPRIRQGPPTFRPFLHRCPAWSAHQTSLGWICRKPVAIHSTMSLVRWGNWGVWSWDHCQWLWVQDFICIWLVLEAFSLPWNSLAAPWILLIKGLVGTPLAWCGLRGVCDLGG